MATSSFRDIRCHVVTASRERMHSFRGRASDHAISKLDSIRPDRLAIRRRVIGTAVDLQERGAMAATRMVLSELCRVGGDGVL
jgi:hypothetical protein